MNMAQRVTPRIPIEVTYVPPDAEKVIQLRFDIFKSRDQAKLISILTWANQHMVEVHIRPLVASPETA